MLSTQVSRQAAVAKQSSFYVPAPRRVRRSIAPKAFIDPGLSGGSDIQALSQAVISTVVLAAGAVLLLTSTPEQQQLEDQEACPRCGGSGSEPCHCTKWSNDGLGCDSCRRTGYTRCTACGGGGKARPAYRPIRIETQTPQKPRF